MRAPSSAVAALRVASCVNRLERFYFENPDESRQGDALLGGVLEATLGGGRVCVTDLVQARRFGTLPTVSSHLAKLMKRGLLEQVVGEDRRLRYLRVTPAGIALLASREHLLGGGDAATNRL